MGTDVFSYRPDKDKIYLLKAETIRPDGSVRAVPDEGIMVQTPERDRSSLIYSGRKQLRLIYPRVSKGAVTHCLVLVERGARLGSASREKALFGAPDLLTGPHWKTARELDALAEKKLAVHPWAFPVHGMPRGSCH